MKRWIRLLGSVAVLGWLGIAASSSNPVPIANSNLIDRGRYLTEHVAMCVECHTPRDKDGDLIRERLFAGAPMPVGRPVFIANQDWAYSAPHIAGLPGLTDQQELEILTEGKAHDRPRPKSPMPQFRMSRDDAQAVIAYLRSLR